ncbi:MAG TPA: hypothetical protein VGM90_16350 [Kofleriaceae bacterium]
MKALVAFAAFLSLAHTASAAPPAWCRAATRDPVVASPGKAATDPDLGRVASGIVQLECFAHDGDDRTPADAAIAKWHLSDDDLADAAAYATAAPGQDLQSLRAEGAWSALDPLGQFALLRTRDDDYAADALDDRLSMAGRLALVERCLRSRSVAAWAVCDGDLRAFDPAKVGAGVHAGWERFALRVEAERVRGQIAQHQRDVAAATAKDPGYAKLFEVARAAATPLDAELRAATLAMDDARATHSRKVLDGCEAKTWTAWTRAVAAIPAKRFTVSYKETDQPADLLAAATITDPRAYLAAVAYVGCANDHLDALGLTLRRALYFWPGFRGPRGAALTAIAGAHIELDDSRAQLDIPRVDRREFLDDGKGAMDPGGFFYVIKSVTPAGKIEFAATPTKEPMCVDYHPGTRLSRIEADGRLVYEGSCGKYEIRDMPHTARSPVTVPARYVVGLHPGMLAFVSVNGDAILLAVAKSGATTPAVVLGAEVK